MKCVLATDRGSGKDYDKILEIREKWPRPKRRPGQLLLRVQACALAPGDVRTLSGYTKLLQTPKGGVPYVPGGDVVGVVVEADEKTPKFKEGDCVIARFAGVPSGGLGEYATVKSKTCAVKPEGMSIVDAAAIAVSPMVALRLAKKWVRKGDRVLVLGSTGGVGIHLIQLLKDHGASFVAATAKRPDLLEQYDVDRPIDYNKENFWEIPEFKKEKFDLVIDLAAPGKKGEAFRRSKAIVKPGFYGGRYISPTGKTPIFRMQTPLDVLSLIKNMLIDSYTSKLTPWVPRFKWELALEDGNDEEWQELFKLVADGKLKIVTDPAGPFPFTEKGVRDAFLLQESRHPIGKVVILVGDE